MPLESIGMVITISQNESERKVQKVVLYNKFSKYKIDKRFDLSYLT